MIDEIVFKEIHLLWPVIFAALCFWLLFIWKELEGKSGLRFYIKILLALFAIVSLAMIALQPSLKRLNKISYSIILSEGYQKGDLDSLQNIHKRIKTIEYIPGQDLTTKINDGDQVFVLGNGLQVFDLWQLDNAAVHFLTSENPVGMTKIKYAKESVVGRELRVEGNYFKGVKGNLLVLKGPGETPLDSIELNGSVNQIFSLKTTLEIKGKFIYSIVENDSLGKQISSSPLAIKVDPANLLKVMVINQFPSFETKYLKNFLAENGHEVIVRSQVSSDRYKYEFFNSAQKGSVSLSTKTLNEIDLLIVDLPSMQKLSKSMLSRLQEAISDQGLGVFIQNDESSFGSTIPLFDASFSRYDKNEVNFDDNSKLSLATYSYQFKKTDLLESIHVFDQTIVSAYRRIGAGRIGTTVMKNTYEMFLKGEIKTYRKLWSDIIHKISKHHKVTTTWRSNELLVFQDQPFHFQLSTVNEDPLVESINDQRIPLVQDIDLKYVWSGITFPRKTGWNEIRMKNDSAEVYDFYVLKPGQWASLEAVNTTNENLRYSKQNILKSTRSSSERPIPSWWFFVIFLASMTVLWLVPKL